MKITQLPPYQTFRAGEEGTFDFRVRNTGNQEGSFDFTFNAYDLIDSTQPVWLKPGEETTVTFGILLPEDLEENDYFAQYTLTPALSTADAGVAKGQVKYHLEGINIAVTASLDKQIYSVGDTARLTLRIEDNGEQLTSFDLFARVNYSGHEEQKSLTLNGNQSLTFDIPLDQITGEKLFYGVYHAGGRSIHLNSIYLYKAGDVLTITADKQVYNPGDTVNVTVSSVRMGVSGQMILTGPGGYSETVGFTGSASKHIPLPSTMTAGTYNINVQLKTQNSESITVSHPIDVSGIQVKIIEAKLDKGKYTKTDAITANLTLTSNIDLPVILKSWVVDPMEKYTPAGESAIILSPSEPLLTTVNSQLRTALSGIHRLVYGLYSGDLLLSSGSEAFDVGDAVLLGIGTDKTVYNLTSEPVVVKANMFGTADAALELLVDGALVRTETAPLDGFATVSYDLSDVSPGSHILKAVLTADGLTSTKETSFIYGSDLPDLKITSVGVTDIKPDSTIQITATIMNQGRTASGDAIVAFHDGETLIDTKSVRALNLGEYETVAVSWNILGKAGDHSITVKVNEGNTVTEFNENNNSGSMAVKIPELAILTETDKDTYKIRQKVYITSTIMNLTASTTYNGAAIMTTAKDSSGNAAYTNITNLGALPPSMRTTFSQVWNTAGLAVDGAYTIADTMIESSISSTKLIALNKAPDFTIILDETSARIKQGETASFIATLTPLNGWNNETSMNIDGLPAGATVTFNPDRLMLPGQSETLVIATDKTVTGTHTLYLTAQGTDEGEIVTHTVPLTLDVSGFGMEAAELSRTIKQLESSALPISISALNGYEGVVGLTVTGLPYGVRASLDSAQTSVPGQAALTVLTSKYVKPGTYALTVTGDDGLVRHDLNLNLVIQQNPDIAPGIIASAGPGPQNEALVRLYDGNAELIKEFKAFDTKYGANAISADIDGDGYDEIIVAQGPDPKNGATFRAFKRDGSLLAEYAAFDTKYGLTLASGDLDGDWVDELIVGAGPDPKNPGILKVLKYTSAGFTQIIAHTVNSQSSYGLNITAGDIDGDNIPEIITAPGPGPNNDASVTIWKYESSDLTPLTTFTAFEGTYGVNITSGDMDGDGKSEIIAGAGSDPKNSSAIRIYKADGTLVREFAAYESSLKYGVNVSSADLDGDGVDEVIAGAGPCPQNDPTVKIFKADGTEIRNLIAYPDSLKYGVKVSGGNTGIRLR